MQRLLLLIGLVGLLASTAQAQTSISGTVTCAGKSAQSLAIPVGDKAGHLLAVSEEHCSWTKPFELSGSAVTDSTQVSFNEINGDSAKGYGFDIGTTAGSDKYFVRFEGPARLQNGIMVSSSGTWSFTGGSGKLTNLKGQGTYTCKGSAASASCDVEGQYQLAP